MTGLPPSRAAVDGTSTKFARREFSTRLRSALRPSERLPFLLCYHGVGEVTARADPHRLFVSRARFEAQIQSLESAGYALVTVDDLWTHVQQTGLTGRLVALTFDDALADTLKIAASVLDGHGTATVFVATGQMGKRHPSIQGDLPVADAAQVKDLASAGWEVGSHTVDHVDLSDVTREIARDQLLRSREGLERIVDRPVTSLAYPHGRFSPLAIEAVMESGYRLACSCCGPGDWSAFSIPRERVLPTTQGWRLRAKMSDVDGPLRVIDKAQKITHRVAAQLPR